MKKRMMAVVITLIMTSTFVGCSSTAAPVKETKETEAMVVKEETVKVAEVKEVEAEPTPEPTPEPTEEPTPEPIVQEGIDTESTLPGWQWIESLNGVISEPKFVIFNDETNKKNIIENDQTIFLEEGDCVALFKPNKEEIDKISGIVIERTESSSYYTIFFFKEEEFTEQGRLTVELNSGYTMKCIITPN